VAIFVLTSILKELQWQIRTETDLMVDQNAEAAVVLRVLAAQIRVVVLVGAPEVRVAMTAMRSQRGLPGRNVLPITQIRRTPSRRRRQFLTKSTLESCL
jgi:hypothetical protein